MGLIKKPSEIAPKGTISVLVYGEPGIGKTTIACSAPNPVLFDYDGGVQRINGAHQVPTLQPQSWEDTNAAIEEIEREMPEVQTIVIDTAGKMLDYMSAYIIKNNPKMKKFDGSLSLQGYGVRKQMFVDFINRLSIMGKNVIFVAHEKEEKRGEEWVKRPEIGGSSAADLIKELDLVGYMRAIGKQRTIAFNPTMLRTPALFLRLRQSQWLLMTREMQSIPTTTSLWLLRDTISIRLQSSRRLLTMQSLWM